MTDTQVADRRSNATCIQEESPETRGPSPLNDHPVGGFQNPLHAASQHAATGENEEKKVTSFAVTVENAEPDKMGARSRTFEPLLDLAEAARLLRIHPKTLRVKARRGIIPAVQIGRVWRFRASMLNRWLEKIAR